MCAQESYGKIKCICIDAGHGGKDPGCVGKVSYEKNITLKVALKVGKLIREKHPDVNSYICHPKQRVGGNYIQYKNNTINCK